jgi:hypothetical protein
MKRKKAATDRRSAGDPAPPGGKGSGWRSADERAQSRTRTAASWRKNFALGVSMGCSPRDAIGSLILFRRLYAPLVLDPALSRSRTFKDDGDLGAGVMRLVVEEAVRALGPRLDQAGLSPRLAIPRGVDGMTLRVAAVATWFSTWLDTRGVSAHNGFDAPWASAIREFDSALFRASMAAGAVRPSEWRACTSRALKECGTIAASDAQIEKALKDAAVSEGGLPTMRGDGGRLMPDIRGLRDSGVLGPRYRPRGKRKDPLPQVAASAADDATAAEARIVDSIAIVEAIGRLERLGRLRGGALELVRRSLDIRSLDPAEWGGRPHHRALVAAGVSWTSLRTTQTNAERARAALPLWTESDGK